MSDHVASSDRGQITLCVINYEGEQHLETTLPAFLEAADHFDEVMIVDNGSTDDGLALFESAFPSAKVIQLSENRGPGPARNAGFHAAANDRILFVDNDVIIGPNTVGPLMAALDDNRKAVLAMPRVLFSHDPGRIQYEGSNSHVAGHMILRRSDMKAAACSNGLVRVNSLVSACFLLDRQRWGPETLFDETFFFNYEDHDLGVRARVLGFDIVTVPTAEVLHGTGTPGLSYRRGDVYATRRVTNLILGRWQTVLKNYQTRSLLLLSPLLLAYEVVLFVGTLRRGWWCEWRAACTSLVSNRQHLRAERTRIQSSRRTADRDIFEAGPLPYTTELIQTPTQRCAKRALQRAFSAYWRWTCQNS